MGGGGRARGPCGGALVAAVAVPGQPDDWVHRDGAAGRGGGGPGQRPGAAGRAVVGGGRREGGAGAGGQGARDGRERRDATGERRGPAVGAAADGDCECSDGGGVQSGVLGWGDENVM